MCNKVLRNAPGRQTTYLQLAKLYASKGFMAEAKQNFVEYAERMHKAGKIQHAFAALKEFADISAESAHLRQTLEDHLRMYGDPERRPGAGTAAPAAPKPQPPDDPSKSGRRKTSSLVFLDVDAPPAGRPPVTGRVPPPPKLPPKPALEPEPVVESLIEPVIAEPDTSLEIETTSLVDGLDPSTAGGMLEGFETTSAEFGEIQLDAQPAPVLQDEVSPDDIPPPAEFEPTVAEEESAPDAAIELEPLLETEIEIEAPVAKAPPVKPTIEDLEGRVADDPDDPEGHKALGEALIEAGERERGVEELDLATTGFETRGNLRQAQDLVDEILRLDPNSVRHRQKQVEFAFKSGDKAKLIDAYVELADTLLRSDLPDKARAVYKRVAEHDPANERAKAALAMLAPVATPPPEPPAKPKAKVRETEGKTAARDAKMTVRDEAVEAGDFVDLSAMILEDDLPVRDTRMKVADEEPTGDEERDFQEMLARFKQGIDENIDEGDFQSHYDLGVAFKEMGLLDEAIAELQKALRAPDGKLRSSEALGVCFLDKGAYVVAESILRRALDLPASGDQERLGVLYWLGRAREAQGKRVEARDLYGRVFAVDIRFRDVRERAKALAKAK